MKLFGLKKAEVFHEEPPAGGIESVCSCVLKKTPRRALLVEGMANTRDERRVEKALRGLPGVTAEADHRSGSVSVLLGAPHSDAELTAAVEAAGFAVTAREG